MIIYRTQDNERLCDVAAKFRINPIILSDINDLQINTTLASNTPLVIPQPTKTYIVKKTDTINKICERFKIKPNSLKRYNSSLCDSCELYEGQPLIIKQNEPYCRIATNGYFGSDTSKQKAQALLPYLSFITVCGCVINEKNTVFLFDDTYPIKLARDNGKGILLRVHVKKRLTKEELTERINECLSYAKSKEYWGLVVSGNNDCIAFCREKSKEVSEYAKNMRLAILYELDRSGFKSYDFVPHSIISYDKYNNDCQYTFEEGEKSFYKRISDDSDVSRSFIDLCGYAAYKDRYLPKEEISKIYKNRRTVISHNENTLLDSISFFNKSKPILTESPENTKAKLELINELGWLGASFDISRIMASELYMITSMFDVIDKPTAFYC